MCSRLRAPGLSLHAAQGYKPAGNAGISLAFETELNRNSKSCKLMPTALRSVTSLRGLGTPSHSPWTCWRDYGLNIKAQGRAKKNHGPLYKMRTTVCWEGCLCGEPSAFTLCSSLAPFLPCYPTDHWSLLVLRAAVALACS